jgi:hypothetical protein
MRPGGGAQCNRELGLPDERRLQGFLFDLVSLM